MDDGQNQQSPAKELKNISPSEEAEIACYRAALNPFGKHTAGLSLDQLKEMYAGVERERAEKAQRDTEENARRLEQARREGVERRLRNHGIDPAGLTDDQIADKLDGIAKREEAEERLKRELYDEQKRRYERDRLLMAAQCPPRHLRNLKGLDDNAQWIGIRDGLANRLGGADGFLVALLGKRGTGKTQIAISVIYRACGKHISARYIKALDLFREIRKSFTPPQRGQAFESEEDIIDRLANVGLLVIDEAHQRGESPWENNTLVNLIDRRYDAMKHTILIANQTKAEFAAALGDSVVSRIHETGEAIECDWGTYRKPVAREQR